MRNFTKTLELHLFLDKFRFGKFIISSRYYKVDIRVARLDKCNPVTQDNFSSHTSFKMS